MKRNEALEHIEAELLCFLDNYLQASIKAQPHKVKASADGILCALEGFGMLPPLIVSDDAEAIYAWEE